MHAQDSKSTNGDMLLNMVMDPEKRIHWPYTGMELGTDYLLICERNTSLVDHLQSPKFISIQVFANIDRNPNCHTGV